MDWPQIFDEQALDSPVPRLYEVREVPRSFLIYPEGLILARDVAGAELDALLAELLPQAGADGRAPLPAPRDLRRRGRRSRSSNEHCNTQQPC